MSDLILWLFIAGIVGSILIYAWPVLVLIGAIAIGTWLLKILLQAVENKLTASRGRKADLIARCTTQHHQILAGDEIGGTYGNYLPPRGLR